MGTNDTWRALLAKSATALLLCAAIGCDDGEGDEREHEDGGQTVDAGHEDGIDAGHDDVDSGVETPVTFPVTTVLPFSTGAPDQLAAVAWSPDGSGFFASGYADDSLVTTSDRSIVVARFDADGALDTSWGHGGAVRFNVSGLGGRRIESATGIQIQSTGKIVVGGVVDHDTTVTGALSTDTDGYVLRLLADGTLDMTFGQNGIRRLNFNDGVVNAAGTGTSGADAVYNIALFADDSILVHGSQRSALPEITPGTPRTDNDWLAMKLTPEGAVDTTWANVGGTENDGKFTLDIGLNESGSARTGVVLADGSIIGGGYTTPSGAPQRPVLYKLDATGLLDGTFGTGGVFNQINLLGVGGEAYGVAVQGSSFVTAGYGRDTGDTVTRLLSFRISATGTIDDEPFYGTPRVTSPSNQFYSFRDPITGLGVNGRSALVLPDDRVLIIGRATRVAGVPAVDGGAPAVPAEGDGLVVLLTPNGGFDTTDPGIGANGYRLFDFGGPSDALYASTPTSLSPAYASGPCGRRVALVGASGKSTQTSGSNDDSAVLVLCFP